MKKPLYMRRAEAEVSKRTPAEIAIQSLKAHNGRKRSGADTLLHLLRAGQLNAQNAAPFAAQPLVKAYLDLALSKKSRSTAAVFIELVKVLAKQLPDTLELPDNVLKIKRIAEMMPAAQRSVEDWRPVGKSANHKIMSLQQHLFKRYPVPAFLENSFLVTGNKYANWYIRWTNGQSPRSFEDSPIPISRRMAHEIQFAPATLDVPDALRWAQAISFGATPQQATAIVQGFLAVRDVMSAAESLAFDPQHPQVFAESVIRFLVSDNGVRMQDYGPVIDYVFDTKYEVIRTYGRLELAVSRPGFVMKGRSAAALIRDVNEWHRQTRFAAAYRHLPKVWKPVAIPDFEHLVGIGENAVLYSIRQLNKQSQLFEEGNAMNHCVASYIGKCVAGSSSIWTLEAYPTRMAPKKQLTIELNSSKTIVQARGKCNRLPTREETALLRIWMGQSGLKSLVF